MIDASMYKYKIIDNENVIEITGLKKLHRIDIILKDKNIHSGNLRIVIENNNSIAIHRLKKVKVKNNVNPNNILGVDKGYTALFATSLSKFYGEKLNQFLTKETERLNSKNAKRNKVWALIKKYTNEK